MGFAGYGMSRNDAYPEDGEIVALYVLKGLQGHGVGKVLFLRCVDRLRKMGCRWMILNCLDGNPSIAFYQRMGGQLVGERRDKIMGTLISERILRFNLS